jgi:hypothetical protein
MPEQRSLIGCSVLLLLGAAALLAIAAIKATSNKRLIVFVLGVACLSALISLSTIMITSAINERAKKPIVPPPLISGSSHCVGSRVRLHAQSKQRMSCFVVVGVMAVWGTGNAPAV